MISNTSNNVSKKHFPQHNLMTALNSCRLVIHKNSNHFSELLSSLTFQLERLGIQFEIIESATISNTLSLHFFAPSIDVIECEISAWQDNKDRPALESLFQAASGIMSIHGRSKPGAMPLGVDYVSMLTAVSALTSMMAAATAQYRGSKANTIKVSMSAVALLGVSQYIADASVLPIDDVLLPGDEKNLQRPPFISKDNILFELETLDATPWLHFWQRLGVDDKLAGRGWKSFQLRYAKAISPLPSELFPFAADKNYAKLENLCQQVGMKISRVVPLIEHASLSSTKASWESGPWTFTNATSCSTDQYTFIAGALPLSGINVIESCRRIQGPLAGHILALLGANVIRMEPPGGDLLRGMLPAVDGCSVRFSALNRLKAVQEINIKSKEGKSEIFELAKNAQVFLHNWAPGKDTQLGLDHATLSSINPEIVYCYASGWGSHVTEIDIPGTDFMAQAHSGVADEITKASDANGGSLFTVLDSLGGAVAAQGVVAGLLQRQINNQGCKVETSLLGAAHLLLQKKLTAIYESTSISLVKYDQSIRLCKTALGMLAIDISKKENEESLFKLLKIKPTTSHIDLAFHEALKQGTALYWQAQMDHAGIPAAIITENLQDINTDQRFDGFVKDASYLHILSPWSFQ